MHWHPSQEYSPPGWLRGPHGQTMVGRVLRQQPEITTRRERWTTTDDDFLDVDILDVGVDLAVDTVGPRGTVIVLHGLEGSSGRSYVRLTLAHLAALGLRGVAVNFRSCSGEPNRRARFYHSGETGDLAFVVARLRAAAPDLPLAAIGFSLGGNVLLKYLGETGAESGLVGAAALSVPFDLAAGARNIERGVAGRIYTQYFLRSLKRKLLAKAERGGPAVLDPTLVAKGIATDTLLTYDEAVTAPLHGFRGADHYYEESSSARFLARIRTPTAVVHAADDPFLPEAQLPLTALSENPWTHVHVTSKGGHLGFLQRRTALSHATQAGHRDARLGLMCWAEREAAFAVSGFVEHALRGVGASGLSPGPAPLEHSHDSVTETP